MGAEIDSEAKKDIIETGNLSYIFFCILCYNHKKSMKGIDKMKSIKYFLLLAESLTGTPKEQIKVIDFEQDQNGLYSGTIEIDGIKEYIHEYTS